MAGATLKETRAKGSKVKPGAAQTQHEVFSLKKMSIVSESHSRKSSVIPAAMDTVQPKGANAFRRGKCSSRLPDCMKSTDRSSFRSTGITYRYAFPGAQKLQDDMCSWAIMHKIAECRGRRETVQQLLSRYQKWSKSQNKLLNEISMVDKLKNNTVEKQEELELADKQLDQDLAAFLNLLKEHESNLAEVLNTAEREATLKMEKMTEVKKATYHIDALNSEIAEYREQIDEYKLFKQLLTDVAPEEWREEQKRTKEQRKEATVKEPLKSEENEAQTPCAGFDCRPTNVPDSKSVSISSNHCTLSGQEFAVNMSETESSDSDEEVYQATVSDLMNYLDNLERQKMFWIENEAETKNSLYEVQEAVRNAKDKMSNDKEKLLQHLSTLNTSIEVEQQDIAKLRVLLDEKHVKDSQVKMLDLLHEKVQEVYKACFPDSVIHLTTVHMLTIIEDRIEELLSCLETEEPEMVEVATATLERQKRQKMRQEMKRLKEEELEMRHRPKRRPATSSVNKRTGRKLMMRSQPIRVKAVKTHTVAIQEEEDPAVVEFRTFFEY